MASRSEPLYATALKGEGKVLSPWFSESIDKYLVPESRASAIRYSFRCICSTHLRRQHTDAIIKQTRKTLEIYSKINLDDQSKHVHDIRDKAWAIRAYPCIGRGYWLIPNINRSSAYSTILERLQKNNSNVKVSGDNFTEHEIMLDIGCFLGHDLRKLWLDGAPSESLIGVDIVSFWEIGLELFRDRESTFAHGARFVEADILEFGRSISDQTSQLDSSREANTLSHFRGKVGAISIFHVLHQWIWDDQVSACKGLCALSKPGTIIVGTQVGNLQGLLRIPEYIHAPQWRHDPSSFRLMWDQISHETGTEWKVQADLREWTEINWAPEDAAYLEEGAKGLDFVVTRIR